MKVKLVVTLSLAAFILGCGSDDDNNTEIERDIDFTNTWVGNVTCSGLIPYEQEPMFIGITQLGSTLGGSWGFSNVIINNRALIFDFRGTASGNNATLRTRDVLDSDDYWLSESETWTLVYSEANNTINASYRTNNLEATIPTSCSVTLTQS